MSEERLARLENHIIDLKTEQASLKTMMVAHTDSQEKYNDRLCKLVEKQDKRLGSLEGTRRTLFGIALGSGGLSGFSFASLFKIFGQ